jgi:hypothetical protein
MALSSTAVQPQVTSSPILGNSTPANSAAALMAILMAMYAAQKSKKQLKKLRRRLVFTYMKEIVRNKANKFKSFLSRKPAPSSEEKTLLYILLGLLVLILIFVEPIVAIVVLLVGILVLLLVYHGDLSAEK